MEAWVIKNIIDERYYGEFMIHGDVNCDFYILLVNARFFINKDFANDIIRLHSLRNCFSVKVLVEEVEG